MTLELYHTYIKRELIRAFAIADELVDYAIDSQLTNVRQFENTLSCIEVLLHENELLFSTIKDYGFFPRKQFNFLLDDFSRKKYDQIDDAFSRISPGDEQCSNDINLLREKLRGQLLECLLLLDMSDETTSCEVTLELQETLEIDVIELMTFLTNHMKQRIEYLSIQKKNTVL
jgi:hypothetical protein